MNKMVRWDPTKIFIAVTVLLAVSSWMFLTVWSNDLAAEKYFWMSIISLVLFSISRIPQVPFIVFNSGLGGSKSDRNTSIFFGGLLAVMLTSLPIVLIPQSVIDITFFKVFFQVIHATFIEIFLIWMILYPSAKTILQSQLSASLIVMAIFTFIHLPAAQGNITQLLIIFGVGNLLTFIADRGRVYDLWFIVAFKVMFNSIQVWSGV